MGGQTLVWLPSHALPPRMGRFRVRVSRQRRDRSTHAGPNCQANGLASRGSLMTTQPDNFALERTRFACRSPQRSADDESSPGSPAALIGRTQRLNRAFIENITTPVQATKIKRRMVTRRHSCEPEGGGGRCSKSSSAAVRRTRFARRSPRSLARLHRRTSLDRGSCCVYSLYIRRGEACADEDSEVG